MMKSLCLDCMLAVLPDLRFRLLSGTLAALPLPASDIIRLRITTCSRASIPLLEFLSYS